jgi:beta-glucosidase
MLDPMIRRLARLALLLPAGGLLLAAADTPRYRDASLPVDERVKDLLGRMTLEEKIAQVSAFWSKDPIADANGNFVPEKAKLAMPHGIGQISRPSEVKPTSPQGPVTRGPRESATFLNDVQRWVKENTRLGIPVMTHEEALHGLAAPKGTHFPIPIGLASSWDPDLIERVMSVAALEARARGTHSVLSPVLDLARDPRWGRTEETYGEDPYLVSRLGVAAIRGYQGSGRPLAKDKVFSTAKHFAVHGPHEGGVNAAPTNFGEREVRDQYLFSFEAAFKEARPMLVMPSYNELDGVPSHQNTWLLQTVLRGEWGFDGLVVSDYYAINELMDRHHTAASVEEAAILALKAGVDIELPDPRAYVKLADVIKAGRLSEATLDTAVARNLRVKFLAGLFEDALVDADRAERVSNAPEHQAVALEAARRSIVLLKNEGGVLPLDRAKLKRLAVIGPNAADVHLGGYSNNPGRGVSLLDGIKKAAGAGVEVLYAEGTRITEHPANWYRDDVVFGDPQKNKARIEEALGVAKQADAASSLELVGQQNELVEAVAALGKPTAAFFIGGRPQALERVTAAVPALLVGWYLGQEGGTAAAEALFGELNPGGKLPITFPRSVGQLPVYYGRKPTSFRPYGDGPRTPLFVFGQGLSYTTFRLDEVKVTPATIPATGKATVSARVTNTGSRAGDEVVQLYIHDQVSSVTRPVKQLRGFRRLSLKPGESATVELPLGPEALRLTNDKMQRVVEPGAFDVMVGTSSEQLTTVKLEVTEK